MKCTLTLCPPLENRYLCLKLPLHRLFTVGTLLSVNTLCTGHSCSLPVPPVGDELSSLPESFRVKSNRVKSMVCPGCTVMVQGH